MVSSQKVGFQQMFWIIMVTTCLLELRFLNVFGVALFVFHVTVWVFFFLKK